MRKACTLALILLISNAIGYCQTTDNWVFNGSFEIHSDCPQRIDALGIMREVEAWWQPTGGSSDYFHPCGGKECGVPRNKMGLQAPHEGEAYCGIYCSQADYREYLQTELRQPLQAGARYRARFFVSLSEKSPHAIATMGAYFSAYRHADSLYSPMMQREVMHLEGGGQQVIASAISPQVVWQGEGAIVETSEWVEVSGEFTAQGGERFMTIGNFAPFNRSGIVEVDNPNAVLPGAYYYIDDVEVVCLAEAPQTMPTQEEPSSISQGDVVTLHEIFFETGKSELLPQSYNELMRLAAILQQRPTMEIEVRGHTDSQGTIEYNHRLSEARAKAVVEYLIGKGISSKRLTWKGYGKSLPIASNDTPEGRQQNRRVDYLVVHQ